MFNGLDAACRKLHALQEHLNQDGGKICIDRFIRVEQLTQSTMIEKQRTGSAWCVVLKLKFVDPHWPLSDFGFTGCLVMPPNFPSFDLSFEIWRETQSWLVIYMTIRRNSLILSTSYKHTPGNMRIDGLDSVTYFCRGRSFHDFPTQRPHPHRKTPVMPVQPTLFCHGRPFNTCTTGCLWRSLILKCHHPSAFYFETPNRTCVSQQILHVTSRSWLATKPCKVLHWSLVGFWVHIHCIHMIWAYISKHCYFLCFFAIYIDPEWS